MRNMRAKATIKDVAEMAGVSISTVSHVLNKTRYVSEDTQNKVKVAIEKLGYSPDASGRTFRTGKKMMIGLIVPDITNSVFSSLIEDVDDVISKYNYNLVISNTRDDIELEKLALRTLSSGVVDGIVIATTSNSFKKIQKYVPEGFPMVFIDRVLPDRNIDSIILDCKEATKEMLEEMKNRGHKNVGFLVGIPHISPTVERVKVYKEVFKENGIRKNSDNICYIEQKSKTFETARKLFESGCTALVATNTAMTHDVLNFVESRKLILGKDIVVGGFVDSEFANRFMNKIPVVYEPMKDMGKCAGEMIIRKIENNEELPVRTLECFYQSNSFYDSWKEL